MFEVLFLLCLSIASAGKTHLNHDIGPHAVIIQRYGVFNSHDTPLGHDDPYVLWNLMVHADRMPEEALHPSLEIVLVVDSLKRDIGMVSSFIDQTIYCCTEELVANGEPGCDEANRLMLHNTYTAEVFQERNPGLFYYYAVPVGVNGVGTVAVHQQINFTATGVWYLILANCGPVILKNERNDQGYTLHIDGNITWRNPFGYLPGQVAPSLFIHYGLLVALTLLFLVWIGYAIRWREGLLGLQYAIGLVIFLFAVEQMIWGLGLTYYNLNGEASVPTNAAGAFFKSVKMTAVRCLLLLVGLGLSITVLKLQTHTTIFVVIITTAYFLFELAFEYVVASKDAGVPITGTYELIAALGMMLTDAFFWVWIVFATYSTMVELREKRQGAKYRQYLILAVLLLVSLSISVVLAFFQAAIETSQLQDEYFTLWWLWTAYWEFIYFACLLSITIIWRPSRNNKAYAYSEQLPQSEPEAGTEERRDDRVVELEDLGEKNSSSSSSSDTSS